jgi:type IV secretion system protein VirB4
MDFSTHTTYGFDGTEFLDNPEVRTPISMYLLHRMEAIIDGRRFMYFMDEFWKWLLDDYFSDFAFNKQKTIRKQNGLGVFATQSPSDVLKSTVSRAIIEQCATDIYLPNPKADRAEYVEGFKLSETEFDIVSNLGEDSRMFLVKQGHNSAIASLDLRGFDDELVVLSGSLDNLALLDEIMADVGDDPETWLPLLQQRVRDRVIRE